MKYLLTFLTALTLAGSPALAEQPPTGDYDVNVQVNGLVCDFCARALEKVFNKREEVNGIHVDLSEHLVAIDLKDGENISDEEITSMISDAGYNVVEIKRDEVTEE